MVFVKVTAGNETRKLQVEEGITFQELKQRVASTFPALSDGKVEFDLRYQDTDGDLIHVSSDAEVATAISHLPADSVWRLLVDGAKINSSWATVVQEAATSTQFYDACWT